MTTTMSPTEVLDLPLAEPRESGASTVRGFLAAVVAETWENEKRVFGESSWRWEAYDALAKAGLIEGERDDDGFWRTLDTATGDRLIREAIVALGGPRPDAAAAAKTYRKMVGVEIVEDRGEALVLRNLDGDGMTYEVSRAYFETTYGEV